MTSSRGPVSLGENQGQVDIMETLPDLELTTSPSPPHRFTFDMEMDDDNGDRKNDRASEGLGDLDFNFRF